MTHLDRLFVYGTLRVGQPAHHWIVPYLARAERATASGVLLALPMGYPGYVTGRGVVHGEVVWLTDPATALPTLDAYEGDEYTRIVTDVVLQSGRVETAWIYALTDSHAIAQGIAIDDWVRYLARLR